jgi:hypothetical protein
MASTYTTDLAIQLMATGENAGTWGAITNTNLVVIQQAIAGYQDISIAGGAQTTALVMTQNALANARNAVIKLSGTITGNQIVTVPNGIEKTWIVSNGTVGAFTVNFKYASTGTGQTWTTTDKGIKLLYSDGTDIQVVDLSTLSGTIASAQIADYAVNTLELATNAVTAIKITQSTITQAKLAANSIGANQIIQSTITQAKLAANSVGPNQLISTGVTAASYTSASITVDADGRITSASSGAAGGGGFSFKNSSGVITGPSSSNYVANPGANKAYVNFYGAGGGGSRSSNCGTGAGSGGPGGFTFIQTPVTGGSSYPYVLAAAGNSPGGIQSSGNTGGNSTFFGYTVNGGSGGPGNSGPGNVATSGNAPGAPALATGLGIPATGSFPLPGKTIYIGNIGSNFGAGGYSVCRCVPGARTGEAASLIIWENI